MRALACCDQGRAPPICHVSSCGPTAPPTPGEEQARPRARAREAHQLLGHGARALEQRGAARRGPRGRHCRRVAGRRRHEPFNGEVEIVVDGVTHLPTYK